MIYPRGESRGVREAEIPEMAEIVQHHVRLAAEYRHRLTVQPIR